MKKSFLIVIAILTIGISNLEAQSQKKIRGKKVDVPGWETIRKTESDKHYYRAEGNALSTRESSAKTKAMMQAKRMLSEEIQQKVKSVSEMYTNEAEIGDQTEFMQSMESLTMVSTKNILLGVSISGYELYFKKKNNKYNAYVLLEVKKEDIKNALINEISKDDKLNLKFNKEKFKEVFDKEMNEGSDSE